MELTPEEKMGIRPKEFESDGKGAIEIVCLYNYECVCRDRECVSA